MADHTLDVRSALRGELSELRDMVLRMGALVEGMLGKATRALVDQDPELAAEVRRTDDVADRMDFEIEEACARLLATQQPLARDLRAITGTLRIAADLERIGDYSADIAKVAQRLADRPYFKPLEDIPTMAAKCRQMVRLALQCFVDGDVELARRIGEMDDEVDTLWKSTRRLIEHVHRRRHVYQGMHLLFVVRYPSASEPHGERGRAHQYMQTGVLSKLNWRAAATPGVAPPSFAVASSTSHSPVQPTSGRSLRAPSSGAQKGG